MKERIAILAGGCFWCLEPVFSQLAGVQAVVSGYTGGSVADPDYELVCTGTTGHAEAVRISFDASVISYDTLLEVFFTAHDPTTRNRQGNDVGTQYRSAIFFLDEEQQHSAGQVIARVNDAHWWSASVVTEVMPASTFYPAEEAHQYYYARNPNQPYCLAVAAPKVARIRRRYASLLKPS